MECDTLLESSWGELQLEVWARSYELPKSQEFKLRQFHDSSLGVSGQKVIWMWVPWAKHKEYYMGEGGGLPRVRAMVSLVSLELAVVCPSTKGAPENELTNLLVGLMQVWVSK